MTCWRSGRQARRGFLLTMVASLLLAGCQTREPRRPPVIAPPAEKPRPAGEQNRVALIVPLSGEDGPVGTSISNAARLALADTGEKSIRLTIYDSSKGGAAVAATQALAESSQLILGPLLAEEVRAVAPIARKADIPVIAFSNDRDVAGDGIFIMGTVPDQSIDRVVRFARSKGAARFGVLAPTGVYGQRASEALLAAVQRSGGEVGSLESYNRTPAAVRSAMLKLNSKGRFDAVLVADSGRIAAVAGPLVKSGTRILGTELWGTDRTLGQTAALRGAWYAAVPNVRFNQLVTRYRAQYGKTPYRLASLGYDAVLLTVRTAKLWDVGEPFPARRLIEPDGFAGVDGIFRFGRDGVVERALEVRQVTTAGSTVVSPASTRFSD
jgi:branched-chain amino acid transport system substrate-binding protein